MRFIPLFTNDNSWLNGLNLDCLVGCLLVGSRGIGGQERLSASADRRSIRMVDTEQGRVQAQLVSIFSEILNVEVTSEDADLFEAGILDSQNLIDLLLSIEQRFDMQILGDDLELDSFRCLEQIATFIVKSKMPNGA